MRKEPSEPRAYATQQRLIPAIQELNFPSYATLTHAEVKHDDMGEKNITTQVKINGDITPDFSKDWEVEFQGEKYIMPLRLPQGAKENTSLNSTIDLTFQHWAIYQLKRWMFFTVQPVETGTAVADKYIADVILNLGDFCNLFGQVLRHYYGDTITIDLNDDPNTGWQYKKEATPISINHSYIWDVLIKLYELFAVRWSIEPNGDSSHYVIKVGYPAEELDHIFEYGFEGGLLKVERQVQSEDIRNMLLGRGGEKNIPKYYFKKSPDEEKWRSDPDWIEELANIYFTNLMGATFRSYVQGWKAAHISKYPGYAAVGESNAYAPWAYRKGYTDSKFDPIEYVKDDESIAKYGPLLGGLDNNDEIYPSIQGSGMDVAVNVEEILSDDVEESVENDAQIIDYGPISRVVEVGAGKTAEIEVDGWNIDIEEGRHGVLDLLPPQVKGRYYYCNPFHPLPKESEWAWMDAPENSYEFVSEVVQVINANGNVISASGIPAGHYKTKVRYSVRNKWNRALKIEAGCAGAVLTSATIEENKWINTFDIWVKNIWNTQKGIDEDGKSIKETDAQYAERVWKPILGDRDKNTAKVVFTTGDLAVSEDYEFTIVDFPKLDTSKSLNGERSHWRIKLAKSDADLESTGLYVPSTQRQGKAGDKFVFIGTEMTHHYVVWAETALDDWKKDQLREKKDIKPTWVVTTDRVRLNNEGKANALIQQLRIGNSLRLADKRFIQPIEDRAYETLYLQSITYTYREPSSDDAALNPDVAIVLSNEYATAANPVATMQGEISALQRQIGSISNVEQIVRAVGDKLYLRKDGISDRSLSPTQFFSLLTSGDFRAGMIGGAGWGAYKDEKGNWVIEADRFKARQELEVNNLVINQVTARGGMIVESAANMEITRVIDADEGYKCYFDQKGGTVANLFHVGDVAMSMVFNEDWSTDKQLVKAYKRKVVAIEDDCVTLCKGYSPISLPDGTLDTGVNGEGIPMSGDAIVHYGSYNDTSRQYVKVRDVVGGGYERYIEGLNSVNAVGTEYYFVGRQAGMYSDRPRWYIGDDNGYVEWVDGQLTVKGSLSLESTIGNKKIHNYVEEAAKAEAEKAKKELEGNIKELQDQIDGVVEAWNGMGAPTLTNYPANQWTTEEERKRHERDIYTDITPYVDDATTPTSGQSWKWYYNSPTDYGWVKVADSEAIKALQLAQISVRDTDVLFISHGSANDAPVLPVTDTNGIITDAKGWQTTAPEWRADRYIWQTTYVRKGDGTASFSDPTCIQGAKGEQGPQGIPGKAGADGQPTYTWIRYADDANGGGISNDPTGKKYIGFAYNKPTAAESNNPADYAWSLIKGDQGIPGPKGADGTQYWTWIKYSDNADGSGMYDTPNAHTKYIGIAVNKTSQTESNTPSDYTWSMFQGPGYTNNLLLNSAFIYGFDNWSIGSYGVSVNTAHMFESRKSVRILQSGLTANQWRGISQSVPAAPGEVFTASIWSFAENPSSIDNGAEMEVWALNSSKDRIGDAVKKVNIKPSKSNEWQQAVAVNAVMPANTAYVQVYAWVRRNGTLWLSSPKLERGVNPAPQWSPAAEEMVGTPAQVVVVNADALVFQYENGFATLLSPQKITLSASVQGIADPTYQWSYRQAGQTGFTDITAAYGRQPTLEVNPNGECMGNAESSTVRCTVNGTVHDEVTIARVSSGANGETGADYTENLLAESGNGWSNTGYPVVELAISGDAPRHGDEVTCTLWDASLGAGKTRFQLFNSGGMVSVGNFTDTGGGVFVFRGRWAVTSGNSTAANTSVRIYTMPNTVTGVVSRIGRVKLERGDNPKPVWTPAPSDSDAYTVILTNESHIFEGDTEKAVDGHTDCGVIVYKGNRQVAATIGPISGMPSGMTAAVSGDGTTSARFTVSVTTALKQKQGTLNVPVTVDGRTFTKVFSWSLSLQGKAHSIAVKSYGYYYTFTGGNGYVKVDGKDVFDPAPSKRGINMVTLNRQTLAKTGQFNYDLYTGNTNVAQARTNFINKINSLDDSVFVCLLFADNATWTPEIVTAMKKLGSLGDIRTDGASRTFAFIGYKGLQPGYALQAQGENAHTPPVEVSAYVAEGMFTTSRTQAGIKEIKEEYYLSTSRETATGDYWRTSAPVWQPDRYIWTRSHVYYTDGTDGTYGEVCSTGAPGFSYAANMLGGAGRQLGPNTAYQLGAYGYAEAPVPGKTYTLTVCYKVGAKDTSIAVFVDNKGYYKIKDLTARVETVEAFRFTCPTPSNSSSPKLDRLAFFHQPNDGDYDGTNTYVKWAVLVEGDNPARVWVPSAAEMAAGVNELRNATFANGSDHWAMSSKSRVDTNPGFAGAGVNSAVWEVSGDTSRHWRGISQGTFNAAGEPNTDITIPTSPGDVWTASVHTLCPNLGKVDDPGDPDAKPPVPAGTVTPENRAMCEIQFYNASGAKIKTVQYSIMPTEQGKWQRHHLTVVAPDGAAYVGLYHWLLANGILYMSKPMLSRGATLGDWTPSPLDTSYLQQALQNDASLGGGLVLATHIQLGYKTESGQYKVMSGLNGIYNSGAHGGGPAFWGGGKLQSAAEYPDDPDSAATMIFHDGTAYFSRNDIRMTDNAMEVGENVRLGRNGLEMDSSDGSTTLQIANVSVGDNPSTGESESLSVSLKPTLALHRYKVTHNYHLLAPDGGTTDPSMKTDVTFEAHLDSGWHSGKQLFNKSLKSGDEVELTFNASVPRMFLYDGNTAKDVSWITKMYVFFGYNKADGSSVTLVNNTAFDIRLNDAKTAYTGTGKIRLTLPVASEKYWCSATIAPGKPSYNTASWQWEVEDKLIVAQTLTFSASGRASRSIAERTILGNDGLIAVWDRSALLVNGTRTLLKRGSSLIEQTDSSTTISYGTTAFEVGSSGIRYRIRGGAWKNLT